MMSVRPGMWPEVPDQTAAVARASFPRGSLLCGCVITWAPGARTRTSPACTTPRGAGTARAADDRHGAAVRGEPDRPAGRGRGPADDWKYCLGLELTDKGFDFSVLSLFRARLLDGGAGRLPLDLMAARLKEAGLVMPGMRQRTDSTHVLARVRNLNRLELAGEAVRAALEELAAAEPGWLAGVVGSSWRETYERQICDLRPAADAARARLAAQFARDGYCLLEQAGEAGAPPAARDLAAVQALRLVLLQQFYREDGPDGQAEVTWREAEHGLPPEKDARSLRPMTPLTPATPRSAGPAGPAARPITARPSATPLSTTPPPACPRTPASSPAPRPPTPPSPTSR